MFLAGMEDGLFPGFRAMEKDETWRRNAACACCRHPRKGEVVSHLCGAPPGCMAARSIRIRRALLMMPEELLRAISPKAAGSQTQLHPIPRFHVRRWRARAVCLCCKYCAERVTGLGSCKPLFELAAGDRVFHIAFGDGLIVSGKADGAMPCSKLHF